MPPLGLWARRLNPNPPPFSPLVVNYGLEYMRYCTQGSVCPSVRSYAEPRPGVDSGIGSSCGLEAALAGAEVFGGCLEDSLDGGCVAVLTLKAAKGAAIILDEHGDGAAPGLGGGRGRRVLEEEFPTLREAGPLVLCVANLLPYKGHRHLLEARSRSVAVHPGARLLLASADGGEQAGLREIVAGTGMGDSVLFAGPRDDVPELLKAADLFVLPSDVEGSPNALLEAMAAGLPCITTDAGGGVPFRHFDDVFAGFDESCALVLLCITLRLA